MGSALNKIYIADFDIKLELTKPDVSGSEIDVDNNFVDFSLCQGNFSEYSAEFDHLDDPTHAEAIQRTGAEANVTFRGDLEDGDLLFFDWRGDINNFEGVREIFTGPSGPMFEVAGLTPLEVLKKIWDDDIIDHIVRETNRYANQMQVKAASKINSRMSRWRDTTGEEIWRFFTIIMLQSFVVNNVEREYWYPSNEQLKIGAFEKIMFFNRFLLLKRCLQFVDNTVLPENPSEFDKVMPVIKHLNQKFSTLYLPEQNVAIKESLLPWKGPLPFAQLIATKRAKVGVKSYELCESRTGYLWRMEVYSGKGHVHAPQEAPQEAIEGKKVENDSESATSEIVYTLMKPLFGKGHTIVMDNSCNAPLLSRLLKTKHKTDTMGSLRLNREFVPETLKCKNKENMKVGEVCFSTTKDLSVVVWKDKNVVAMISTFHQPQVGGNEKYGYKYKPKVMLDYNLSMGGVDHKDQTLHAFPLERVRNTCWYQKLFRRLLNVSVHNAMVIYNHDRTQKSQLGNRDFRLQLVREMLQMCSISGTNCSPTKPPKPPSPTPLSQLHLPAKNQKSQRCKLCYEAKVRRATVWRCSTCQVNLCIEGCYTAYHVKYVCK
ncbi:unnamed protein product [Euphydryas editha]|uniref:PiggyBac transposable element-derived protein domain-containing protein n=1 Tax=Euphydryas editha TaxID=104508 RepID=A0AAU9UE52_EUPED|nr:unnamed protein product [Euphydryas editha]